jgi:hypothetical protein
MYISDSGVSYDKQQEEYVADAAIAIVSVCVWRAGFRSTYTSTVVFASWRLAAGVRTFSTCVILGAMIVTTLESDSQRAMIVGAAMA